MEELIYSIGSKLKALRVQQKLTIKAVSQRAKVTKSLISQIENGKTLPSLKSLIALTTALDTTVGFLFSSDAEPSGVVVKASERKVMHTKNGVILYLLTPNLRDRQVEFLSVVYEKDASSGILHAHKGEEYGIVLKGRIHVIVQEETYILEKGDSIVINSEIPHKIDNAYPGTTEVIWANTPPTL